MVKHLDQNVYVVDSHATLPPLPPRVRPRPRQAGATQTLLILLVSLALCGMVIEACFIYRLYSLQPAASASFSKLSGGEDVISSTNRPNYDVLPSKPVAHLTDGQDAIYGKEIMTWSMVANPLLFEMEYKNGSLIIQKEGYYYVYSKVFFSESIRFNHFVQMNTDKYGDSITLLESRKYSKKVQANSYLGGVFHLYEGDAVFVKVSNTSNVRRHKSSENFFGAFMI